MHYTIVTFQPSGLMSFTIKINYNCLMNLSTKSLPSLFLIDSNCIAYVVSGQQAQTASTKGFVKKLVNPVMLEKTCKLVRTNEG